MSARARFSLFFLLLAGVIVLLFFVLRRETRAQFGPLVALCPGPDYYGYTCEPGGQYAYIDARQDTQLYLDDGVVTLELPFPFTFYGTTYTSVTVGSNGTLQFGATGVPEYANSCLNNGPVAYMGDMIAVYWDDLDLTAVGYLETAVVGEAPNRIFVVEWDDVPRYGSDRIDTLTFSVQLFEGSNDIVLLYQDVTLMREGRGNSATIGVQSAAQGLALQYSCDQPALADGLGLKIAHPPQANNAVRGTTAVAHTPDPDHTPAIKGPAPELLARLAQRVPLERALSRQTAVWQLLDLTGNGREELVVLWQGAPGQPHPSHLAVIAAHPEHSPAYTLLLNQPLAQRGLPATQLALVETADLTGDAILDVLLWQQPGGQLWALTAHTGTPQLLPLPGVCAQTPRLRLPQAGAAQSFAAQPFAAGPHSLWRIAAHDGRLERP